MTLTIEFPSSARPASITRKFVKPGGTTPPYEAVDIYAPKDTPVYAGADGKIQRVVITENDLNYDPYVAVVTKSAGEKMRVLYINLKGITVTEGMVVAKGTLLGYSRGPTIKLVVQTPKDGLSGFVLPYISHPKRHLTLSRLRLRPTDNRLRLRASPDLASPVVGMVDQWDLLIPTDSDYRVLTRGGKDNKWLRVQNPSDGSDVYAAAWYLKAVSANDPREGIPGIPIPGINLDLDNPRGTPAAAPLVNLGWVRLLYNVSYNPANGTYGNTDLPATFNRYKAILERYAYNGNRVILVLNHQTYGEAQGYNWNDMTDGKWQELAAAFAYYVGQIAQQFAGRGLIYAYQIWNEQDSPPSNTSAVAMPAVHYANLFQQAVLAIRAVDSKVQVITGGHATGPDAGSAYARATLSSLSPAAYPDGIGIHPYLTGPIDSPFSIFGTINRSIEKWSGVLPNTPLWFTEWGILDRQGDDSIAIEATAFAAGFLDICLNDYRGMVACAVWYAWADGMHNGYGLVRDNGSPREPLYSAYLGFS
jgi:hypothetical protein